MRETGKVDAPRLSRETKEMNKKPNKAVVILLTAAAVAGIIFFNYQVFMLIGDIIKLIGNFIKKLF